MKHLHIVIDAIDGAGKGTVTKAVVQFLTDCDYKTLRIYEPSMLGLGKFIREELIAKHADGHTYSGRTAAIAYAMDREQLYRERLFPFLETEGRKAVVQDRGLLSSLVYQPAQDASVTVEWLLSLEGNQLELAHAPDLLIILRVDADIAMERIQYRLQKNDNSIFERNDFQKVIAERYRDPTLLAPFIQRGTRVEEIDSGQEPDKVIADVLKVVRTML